MIRFSDAERRARLVDRHRLRPGRRADRVDAVADDLVGLHSSDPVTVYLSLSARMHGATTDSIERALYDDRSVVRHHAMRRTLWVFSPQHARLAHASTTLGLVAPQRRALVKMLAVSGVADDAGRWLDDAIEEVAETIRELGEATARELGERVPSLRAELGYAPGKAYGGTIAAHTRVLVLMGFMGRIVRTRPLGSWISGQYRWAEAESWIDGLFGAVDADEARALVVDRYLRSFGPASLTDIAWWTGWAKRTSSTALTAAHAAAVLGQHGEPLYAAADDPDVVAAADADSVALLPALDPTVMGWRARDWYLDPDHVPALFDRNGNAGPTIWADGRVVGGWAQRADGTIATKLLVPVSAHHRVLLDDEIDRLTTFLGDSRFTVRFQTPLTRELTE